MWLSSQHLLEEEAQNLAMLPLPSLQEWPVEQQ